MTTQEVLDQARYITKTAVGDNVGETADLLRILNDCVQRQVKELVNTNDTKFGVKAKANLNVNPNQEAYRLPSDWLKLKRVEVTYDGSKWYPAEVVDDANYLQYALDSTTISQQFTTNNPKAALFGDSLYLRPIPTTAVTEGLRIWYVRMPSLLSSASASLPTPSEYHQFLAYGVAKEIALRQGENDLYDRMAQMWEDGLAKIRNTFAPRATGEELNLKDKPTNYA